MKLIFTQHVDKAREAAASKALIQGWCLTNKIAMETRSRDLDECLNEIVLEDEDGFVLQWADDCLTMCEIETLFGDFV